MQISQPAQIEFIFEKQLNEQTMGYLKQKFRNIKKLPDWLYWFPAFLLRLIFRSLYRFEMHDPHGAASKSIGVVGVAWHNRLLFFAAAFPREVRRNTLAVVSPSRDGQYVADFIAQFGLGSLRGSSSKRGAHAQLAAIHAIRERRNVVFTPDGPRGPRYVMKSGPVHLASITGAPIQPVSINASRCWQLRSWDRFQIPCPGAKITLIMGEPIFIPPNLSASELEAQRLRVEQALMAITHDPEN